MRINNKEAKSGCRRMNISYLRTIFLLLSVSSLHDCNDSAQVSLNVYILYDLREHMHITCNKAGTKIKHLTE